MDHLKKEEAVDILEKIKLVVQNMDEIEGRMDELPNLQSEIDYKLQDLYHYIENSPIKTNEAYRLIKEIKRLRTIRRDYKIEYELINEFRNNYQKLTQTNNRKMLLACVGKKLKQITSEYKNKGYTDEEIQEVLGTKAGDDVSKSQETLQASA